jgi:hypothetical protein
VIMAWLFSPLICATKPTPHASCSLRDHRGPGAPEIPSITIPHFRACRAGRQASA